jgi:CheY-like chemotaxis protein
MSLGLILYIDDSESQRKALKMVLENRGFSVEVAGDVATARSLFEKRRGQIDVAALDMRLEDPQWPQMTGADVAIEYYSPQTPDPPEFLIHSAYSEVDYYKLALRLQATTYLDKSEYSQDDLIRHVRALVIRRAFNVRIQEIVDRIQDIVETSPNRSEAIARLCHEVAPIFSGRVGTPFVFLVTESDYTYCYTSEPGFPKCLDMMPDISGPEEKKALERLDAAAFIPLIIDEDLRLSIGLLNSDLGVFPLAEPPAKMASVLARHLTPNVIKPFLVALKDWNRRHIESIRITGDVCLSVLQQLGKSFPEIAKNNCFRRLQNLIEDLQSSGSIMGSIVKADAHAGSGLLSGVKVKQIIEGEWADIDHGASADLLRIYGNCDVTVTPGDLSFMVSSVLQWFAQRLIHTPSEIEPHVTVDCRRCKNGAELIFEDRSARLDKKLREYLFTPFAEPILATIDADDLKSSERPYSSLFLTKVLLEVRYNGLLEDISDENDGSDGNLEERHGHRFRMYFPDLHSGAYN